jgi:DNA-binding HxlR family transcriptional regulator
MESIEFLKENLIQKGQHLLKLVTSRGTIEIISLLCSSPKKSYRFTEISRLLNHIGTKTLASRLKNLEQEGILLRKAYNEIPPRVEYSITEKGLSLATAGMPLIHWIIKTVA